MDLLKDAYVQEKVEEAAKLFYTNDTVTINLYWAAAAALLFFLRKLVRGVSQAWRKQTLRWSSQFAAVSLEGLGGVGLVPGDNLTQTVNIILSCPHLNLTISPAGSIPLQYKL